MPRRFQSVGQNLFDRFLLARSVIVSELGFTIQLMTLTDRKSDSKSLSKKSENVTAEDGKVNTTLPASSLENRENNVTVSSGEAEREVNEIMENKRREPIVVFIGHSDCEELPKDESSELPKCFWGKYFI